MKDIFFKDDDSNSDESDLIKAKPKDKFEKMQEEIKEDQQVIG